MNIARQLTVSFDEAARRFFRSEKHDGLTKEARQDVAGAAREILFRNKSVLSGKGEVRDPIGFCYDILRKAFATYLAHEAWCKRATSLADLDFEQLRAADPLSTGCSIYISYEAALIKTAKLESPPKTPQYAVEFAHDYSDLQRYRSDPFYIPLFMVVPKEPGVEALRVRGTSSQGKRARLYGDELPLHQRLALDGQRVSYAAAIRRMLPKYLRNHGWRTLDRKQRQVLSQLNKNLTKREMCANTGLTLQSLNRAVRSLERRGYEPIWKEPRQQLVYEYNPVLDGARKFTSKERLEAVQRLPFAELIEITGKRLDDAVAEDSATEELFIEEYQRARQQALRSAEDYATEYDYDQRLRQFIKETIERPSHLQGLSLQDVERLLELLPQERQEELVLEAIRTRNSIADLLTLPDHFPELYRKDPLVLPTLSEVA